MKIQQIHFGRTEQCSAEVEHVEHFCNSHCSYTVHSIGMCVTALDAELNALQPHARFVGSQINNNQGKIETNMEKKFVSAKKSLYSKFRLEKADCGLPPTQRSALLSCAAAAKSWERRHRLMGMETPQRHSKRSILLAK